VRRLGAGIAAIVAVATFATVVPHASAATPKEIATALLAAINQGREGAGLQDVTDWRVIRQQAKRHSKEQAAAGQINHDGFDTRAATIRRAGSGINGVCENVAYVSGTNDPNALVRTFYRGWDQSPPHHACMFDEDFRSTWAGVGIAHSGSTWYATYIAAQDASPNEP